MAVRLAKQKRHDDVSEDSRPSKVARGSRASSALDPFTDIPSARYALDASSAIASSVRALSLHPLSPASSSIARALTPVEYSSVGDASMEAKFDSDSGSDSVIQAAPSVDGGRVGDDEGSFTNQPLVETPGKRKARPVNASTPARSTKATNVDIALAAQKSSGKKRTTTRASNSRKTRNPVRNGGSQAVTVAEPTVRRVSSAASNMRGRPVGRPRKTPKPATERTSGRVTKAIVAPEVQSKTTTKLAAKKPAKKPAKKLAARVSKKVQTATLANEYKVEKIVEDCLDPDTLEHFYCVKWKGFDVKHNTWEPRRNLVHCTELVHAYDRTAKKAKTSSNPSFPSLPAVHISASA